MGIFNRFINVMKANANSALDKLEDPGKLIDQQLLEVVDALDDVKQSCAEVIADEKRCRRMVAERVDEIERLDVLARRALEQGNEDDARVVISRKQKAQSLLDDAKQTYMEAKKNADAMRELHDQLCDRLIELRGRRQSAMAKISVAEARCKVNSYMASDVASIGADDAFTSLDEKIDRMMDTADALVELSEKPKDAIDELSERYDAVDMEAAVEVELEKMKAELNNGGKSIEDPV